MGQESDFKVVIGEKDEALIILLLGNVRSQEAHEIEKLQELIVNKPQTAVIISFRDVTAFTVGVHREFAKLQTEIRKSGKYLGLCSFRPEIKSSLMEAGVLRESELYNNIPLTWQALKAKLAVEPPVKEDKKAA